MGGLDFKVLRRHPLNTTSCQNVVHESLEIEAGTGTVIVQTDLSHPKLYPVATGHVVNERVLTPSTLWADMAMTIANYLYPLLAPDSGPVGFNMCEMEVHKPLVVDVPPGPDGQHVQCEAHANIHTGEMTINVRSVTWDGTKLVDHGHGLVKFEDPDLWAAEWTRQKFLVQGQIDLLRQNLTDGTAHLILKGLAYKLFEQLVTYSPKYQGMQEVILDRTDTAAFARVKLQYTPGLDGEFYANPYAIDNLCHLSGFIVNAADVVSDEPLVYISHGWESLKFLNPGALSPEKEYITFVRMVPGEKNISQGDVYVFDDAGEIVAVLYGLKFQGIPRRLMNALLPPIQKKVAFEGPKAK